MLPNFKFLNFAFCVLLLPVGTHYALSFRDEDLLHHNNPSVRNLSKKCRRVGKRCRRSFRCCPGSICNELTKRCVEVSHPLTLSQRSSVTTGNSLACPLGRTNRVDHVIRPDGKLFDQISYIAVSNQRFGGLPVAWLGSDQGSDDRQTYISAVALARSNSFKIATYMLDINAPDGTDWESISLGPCSSKSTTANQQCLFIGNMGNNEASKKCASRGCPFGRPYGEIYILQEPDVAAPYANSKLQVITLRLDYENNQFPTDRTNTEAMFVDFTGDNGTGLPGDIYIVTKFTNYMTRGLQSIGRIPVSWYENLRPGDSVELSIQYVGQPVRNYNSKKQWLGADMSANGQMIALRSGGEVFIFHRAGSQSVADALTSQPCLVLRTDSGEEDQNRFEAVAFIGNTGYLEISECDDRESCDVNVHMYDFEFSRPIIAADYLRGRLFH